MKASVRKPEFEVACIDPDPTRETVTIVALSPRARAWLDRVGAHAIAARINVMGCKMCELGDAVQNLLEEDARELPADPVPPLTFAHVEPSQFAVEYEDAACTDGDRIATIIGLTPRARGWLNFQGDEIARRISIARAQGEAIESVCQRLLEADLGMLSLDKADAEASPRWPARLCSPSASPLPPIASNALAHDPLAN